MSRPQGPGEPGDQPLGRLQHLREHRRGAARAQAYVQGEDWDI